MSHRPAAILGLLPLLLLGALAPGVGRADDPPARAFLPHVPAEWLVIEPTDVRERRPFNPDAVFARHLLDPASPPPVEGESLTGETGEAKAWHRATAGDDAAVAGSIAWAYAQVQAPRALVAMAWLKGGSTLFVNGTPFVGAVYGDRFEVPVKLQQGLNHVYVRGVRGAFTLTFTAPPAGVFLAPFRQTLPDVAAGEPLDAVGGLLVVNAREQWLDEVAWTLPGNDWLAPATATETLAVPPLGLVQIHVPLRTREGTTAPADAGRVEVALRVDGAGPQDGPPATFSLDVRPRAEAVIHTFVSGIDDSVQRFGLLEPAPGGSGPKGLVLTLHGAGVDVRGQVHAYAPKPDFWIAAPTNRDRFGFDWQDWGRLDAYEVRAQALRISGVDPHRVYLTGHSMGGHGTWHLGANDPDGFAAIAPSAGWISFDTYPAPRRTGLLTDLWRAADAASETRDLLANLAQLPTYILHGDLDDNVPLAQAREMERLLKEAGGHPETHVEAGKGHWWDGHPEPGAQCVDWPGIFDLFRRTVVPDRPRELRFRTVDPGVDARHHWLEVCRPLRRGAPCDVHAVWDPQARNLRLETTNVGLLRLDPAIRPRTVNGLEVAAQAGGLALERLAEEAPWRASGASGGACARAQEAGPLRRAFAHRFVFVPGTSGTPEETAALLERARFDAERWMYRGNGQGLVIPDTDLLAGLDRPDAPWRGLVLYGHAQSNAALARLFDLAGPVLATRGRLRVDRRAWTGPGLGAAYVQRAVFTRPPPGPALDLPRADVSHAGLAVVLADTGVRGTRLGCTLPLFVSGVGWPDFVAFGDDVLTAGDGGVRAAGWFAAEPDGKLEDVQAGAYARPDGEALASRDVTLK